MDVFINKAKNILNRASGIIAFLVLWEVLARAEVLVNPKFFPPLSKVLKALWGIIMSGELLSNFLVSIRRSLIGLICGLSVAIPLGLMIGWFKGFGYRVWPLLQVLRNMPTLALLPLFVMFFGIGELSKNMIILWGVMWATLLNTISGVRNVDPQLIKASKSMGTGKIRLFATVVLPASLPYIFAGMRLSMTTSVLILIAAEMMGANSGLGFALDFYQSNFKIPQMYAYLLIMALIGTTLNFTLEAVEKRFFRWRDDVKQ
jgi:NitT/TauT family transport system permease protein